MSIVKLNIGGVRFETSTATLCRYPDTMLARLIQQPTEVESINNGRELFIDRDGTMFAYILNYLRHGDQTVLPTDDPTRMISLKQEADFYGLTGLVELVKLCGKIKIGDLVRFREQEHFVDYFKKLFDTYTHDVLAERRCEICHEVAEIGPYSELHYWSIDTSRKSDPLGRIEEIHSDCARVIYTFGSMRESFTHLRYGNVTWEEANEEQEFERLMGEEDDVKKVKDFMVTMHIPLMYLKKVDA